MSRKKNDFVKAFGTSFEIFKRLSDAVVAEGGNDDDLREILVDGQLTLNIALLLLKKARLDRSPSTDGTFGLDVNWESPIEELIKDCSLDEHERIHDGEPERIIPKNAKYKVLQFQETVTHEAIQSHCNRYGYETDVHVREFLAYVALLPRSFRGSAMVLQSMAFRRGDGAIAPRFSSDGTRRVIRPTSMNSRMHEVKAGDRVLVRLG